MSLTTIAAVCERRALGCVFSGRVGAVAFFLAVTLGVFSCRLGYEELPLALHSGGVGATSGASGGLTAGNATGAEATEGGRGGASQAGSATGGASGDPGGGGSPADAGAAGARVVEGGAPPIDPPPTKLPCSNPINWKTDFSSDPTQLDQNGDGQPDFVWLVGGSFPTQDLAGGIWTARAGSNLSTFPKYDFSGPTYLRVVARDNNPPTQVTNGFSGALAWVNVDYTASGFGPVYISVTHRDAALQDSGVWGKISGAGTRLVGPVDVQAQALVTAEIRIFPDLGKVWLWIDGVYRGEGSYMREPLYNDDRFATLHVPVGSADYDEFDVESCPK